MPPLTGPAYRIVTPRLILRCWDPADTTALAGIIAESLEHLRPFVEWAQNEPRPFGEKLAEVRKWRAEFDLDYMWHYAVLTAEDERLIGALMMARRGPDVAETGGWVTVSALGHGYFPEATAAAMRAGFEVMELTRIQATNLPTNEKLLRATADLGFTQEGQMRHLVNGRHVDEMLWSMLADEWPASNAARLAARARGYDCLGNRIF